MSFNEAYKRILEATGCSGLEELAAALGLRQSCFSDCERRDLISEPILLALVENFGLNPQWVRKGTGCKYIIPSDLVPWEFRDHEAQQKLACVELLCRSYDRGRGIWKQIDENREVLQFLWREAPELLQRAGYIELWIGDTDIFLGSLNQLLELERPVCSDTPWFPRPWPGKHCDAAPLENAIESIVAKIRKEVFGGSYGVKIDVFAILPPSIKRLNRWFHVHYSKIMIGTSICIVLAMIAMPFLML